MTGVERMIRWRCPFGVNVLVNICERHVVERVESDHRGRTELCSEVALSLSLKDVQR